MLAEQRAVRKAERTRQNAETKAAKEKFVAEAERLAAGNDWRGGVNRFRALLDQWKALPRLDRATDDELWHRFSSARTTYTRRRKAQFAAQSEQRETARVIKEKLVAEAEALADSTDWGPTTGTYRDLMTRWKAAGPAPRGVDEALWKRFRGAQDTFFAAKQATMTAQDTEFQANAEAKEQLLVEGERLLPISDLAAAETAYRELLGTVGRDRQGAPGRHPAAGQPAARDRDGDRCRRGGALAPEQPRGAGSRRGHGGQAGGADLRARGARGESRSSGRSSRRAGGHRSRRRPIVSGSRRPSGPFPTSGEPAFLPEMNIGWLPLSRGWLLRAL